MLPCVGFSSVVFLWLIVTTVLDLLLVFYYCGCKYVPSMLSMYVIKRACEIVPALLRLLSFY